MHFLQAINSDISVLIVCNKTGGTIKGDIKKKTMRMPARTTLLFVLACYFCFAFLFVTGQHNVASSVGC